MKRVIDRRNIETQGAARCRSSGGTTLDPAGDASAVPSDAIVRKFRSEFEVRLRQ